MTLIAALIVICATAVSASGAGAFLMKIHAHCQSTGDVDDIQYSEVRLDTCYGIGSHDIPIPRGIFDLGYQRYVKLRGKFEKGLAPEEDKYTWVLTSYDDPECKNPRPSSAEDLKLNEFPDGECTYTYKVDSYAYYTLEADEAGKALVRGELLEPTVEGCYDEATEEELTVGHEHFHFTLTENCAADHRGTGPTVMRVTWGVCQRTPIQLYSRGFKRHMKVECHHINGKYEWDITTYDDQDCRVLENGVKDYVGIRDGVCHNSIQGDLYSFEADEAGRKLCNPEGLKRRCDDDDDDEDNDDSAGGWISPSLIALVTGAILSMSQVL